MKTFLIVVLMLSSLAIIVSTLLQEPKSEGMGTLSGSDTNVFGKMAHRSKDAILTKINIISAVIFMVTSIIIAAMK